MTTNDSQAAGSQQAGGGAPFGLNSPRGKLLYYGVVLALALTAPLLFVDDPKEAGQASAQTPQPKPNQQPTTNAPGAAPSPVMGGTGDKVDQAGDTKGAPAARLSPEARAAKAQRVTLESDSYTAVFTTLNGGLTRLSLKGERFEVKGEAMNLVSTDKERYLPLSFEVAGATIPEDALWNVLSRSPQAVTLQWEGDGVRIRRKLEAGEGPFQLWVTTTVDNLSDRARELTLTSKTFHYVAKSSEESPIPFLPVRAPDRSSGICEHGDEVEREDGESLVDEQKTLTFDSPRFAAAENVYFLLALAASPGPGQRCSMRASHRGRDESGDALGTLFEVGLTHPTLKLGAGEQGTLRTLAYFGPKTPKELQRAGHGLEDAIDTGFFSLLAKLLTQMLRWIYELVQNWGLAIILLTFAVKALLYPLTAKQMHSMARMKELKPEMDRINDLYADDREAKGAAMMELYRKKGVNPAAGCFPMLIQLPIWFSLYTSLSTNVELFHAPFALWWTDLSSPDPFFVLPLALGVLMFLQQKMSPATVADPMQQKMMLYLMPTMITSFMLFLPAGLCLYMFTNSALSIGQQRLIEAQLATKSAEVSGDAASGAADPATVTASATAGTAAPSGAGAAGQGRPKTTRPSKAERRARRGK